MSLDRTVKCPICDSPYKFYAFSAADQSACGDCVRKAESRGRQDQFAGDIKRLLNQCDGCRAGLPLVNGVHKDHQSMGIGCTKHLYT